MNTAVPSRLHCPNCGRFLGTASGYFEPPPCQCGWQTTRQENGTITQSQARRGEQARPTSFRREVESKAN